jgi:hypothetical protein
MLGLLRKQRVNPRPRMSAASASFTAFRVFYDLVQEEEVVGVELGLMSFVLEYRLLHDTREPKTGIGRTLDCGFSRTSSLRVTVS